jgi:hypothetical protein
MRVFSKNKRGQRTAAVVLVSVLTLVFLAAPSEAGVCEKALGRCLIEAGMASLISVIASGGITAALLGQFCVNGYLFCLQYY